MTKLCRTIITIWPPSDPADMELENLTRKATHGNALALQTPSQEFTLAQAARHAGADNISGFFPEVREATDREN